jgi:hypothetical protein
MKSVDKQLNNIISNNIRIILFNRISKKTCNQVYFHVHNQSYKQLDVQMHGQLKQNISL